MHALRMLGTLAAVALLVLSAACGDGDGNDGGTGGGSGGSAGSSGGGSAGGSGGGSGAVGSVTFSGGVNGTLTSTADTFSASVIVIPGGQSDGGTQSGLSLQFQGVLPNGYKLVYTNSTTLDLPFATGAYVINDAGEPLSFATSTIDYRFDGGTVEQEWEADYSNDDNPPIDNNFSVTITSTGAQSTIPGSNVTTYPDVHGSFTATFAPDGNDAGVNVAGTF